MIPWFDGQVLSVDHGAWPVDVYRIMQTTRPAVVAETMRTLSEDPMSVEVAVQALEILHDLFARRTSEGVAMAQRALQLAVDPEQVATLCVAFSAQLLSPRS